MSEKPWTQLQMVANFLGVEDIYQAENFYRPEGASFYCFKDPQGCLLNGTSPRKYIEVSAEVLERIRHLLHPQIKELHEWLGRSFKWSRQWGL